jgi:homoserine kinase
VTRREATAFAPASSANLCSGFDLLGHSLDGWRDHATVRRIDAPEVRIEGIEGVVTALPARAEDNISTCFGQRLCKCNPKTR